MTGVAEDGMSRERTPMRERVGRSRAKDRSVRTGFTWLPPDQVPGAILPASVEHELRKKLRAIDECQARARVSAASYVIYR